jgi:hypothetical protein
MSDTVIVAIASGGSSMLVAITGAGTAGRFSRR